MHTIDDPYCSDPGCWCHFDATYHDSITGPLSQEPTDEQLQAAYSFLLNVNETEEAIAA